MNCPPINLTASVIGQLPRPSGWGFYSSSGLALPRKPESGPRDCPPISGAARTNPGAWVNAPSSLLDFPRPSGWGPFRGGDVMDRAVVVLSVLAATAFSVAGLLAGWDLGEITDQDFRAGVFTLLSLIVIGVNK